MVGISVAAYLQEQGKKVAVFEAKSIGQGVTGHSTAKLSSLHKDSYTDVVKNFGDDGAKTYAEVNEAGIDTVERYVQKYKINCEFKRISNFTFTTRDDYVDKLTKEFESTQKAGMKTTFYNTGDVSSQIGLPFPVKAAIGIENQAQFNSYAYISELAKAFVNNGGVIYEDTRISNVHESFDSNSQHTLDVDHYNANANNKTNPLQVTAKHVVLATHLPIADRSGHFTFTKPMMSYVMAFSVHDQSKLPPHMYLNQEENPSLSIRYANKSLDDPNSEKLLVISSGGHLTGAPPKGGNQSGYQETFDNTVQHFGENFIKGVEYKWSAMDYIPADGVPYIGYINRVSNIFTATGFNKWGLSWSAATGKILHDLMSNKEGTEWTKLVDARRWDLKGSIAELTKIVGTVQNI